ncbi:MAG: SRPBCC family protein [Gaiellaceae bacterium]
MTVDEDAPVLARSEIEIAADARRVWEILTDIDRWPTWNRDVKRARLSGGLSPGAVFRWKAGPGTITSAITDLEPERTIAWRGRTLGLRALHVYHLEPRDERTFVRTEESWDGVLARLLRRRLQRMLEAALAGGLEQLRAAAERPPGTVAAI